MSIKEKKLALLASIYKELQIYNLIMDPMFLQGVNALVVLKDKDLCQEKYVISMDKQSTVKVVATYTSLEYGPDIASRRNAVKTARDIFEFCHEFQTGEFSRIDKSLVGKKMPRISLYYRNAAKESKVVVEATRRYLLDDFLYRGSEKLHELNSDLNQLTKLIEEDHNGAGKELRWEKEIYIAKQWWRH